MGKSVIIRGPRGYAGDTDLPQYFRTIMNFVVVALALFVLKPMRQHFLAKGRYCEANHALSGKEKSPAQSPNFFLGDRSVRERKSLRSIGVDPAFGTGRCDDEFS